MGLVLCISTSEPKLVYSFAWSKTMKNGMLRHAYGRPVIFLQTYVNPVLQKIPVLLPDIFCKTKIVYEKDKFPQPQKVPKKDLSISLFLLLSTSLLSLLNISCFSLCPICFHCLLFLCFCFSLLYRFLCLPFLVFSLCLISFSLQCGLANFAGPRFM